MQKIAAFLLLCLAAGLFFSCKNNNTVAAVGLSGRPLRYVAYVGFNFSGHSKGSLQQLHGFLAFDGI